MDKHSIPHIEARVLNQPLLLEPGYAKTFFSALAKRMQLAELHDAAGQVDPDEWLQASAESYGGPGNRYKPYMVKDGVAVIPIQGTLVHKFGYLQPSSGMTGYDGIVARHRAACEDPDVKGVLLDMDTPGGEVAGCFDAARQLRAQAESSGKPLWALCYDMACSAGMAIASAASRRLITQTGEAGSVGVVMAHTSYERALEKEGLVVTLIHSGAKKVDGNPYENLDEEVLARFQAETDSLRRDFVALVAEHIGLSGAQVLATEAGIYRGEQAIDIGFADELVNGNDAVAIFAEHLRTGRASTTVGDTAMTTQTTAAAQETQVHAATPIPAAESAAERRGAEQAHQRYSSIMSLSRPGIEAFVMSLANDQSVTLADAKMRVGDELMRLATDRVSTMRAERNEVVTEEPATRTSGSSMQDRWERNEGGLQSQFLDYEGFVAFTKANDAGLVRMLGQKG